MNSFWKGFCSVFDSFKTFNIFGNPPIRREDRGWEDAFKKDAEQIRKGWESVIGKWDEKEQQ